MDHLVIDSMHRLQQQRAEELEGFAAAAMDMLSAVPSLGLDRLLDDEELRGRSLAVEVICNQVLFLTMCALRAFCGVISAPRILIYGPGYVGGRVVDRLIEHGCAPMLRVFVRNALALHKWRAKSLKASDSITKLLRAGTFEVVINCSNYASFVQFTRDMLGKVSPKTCVITASFGLQRSRLYQILKTPCVFRTFVERIDVAGYTPEAEFHPGATSPVPQTTEETKRESAQPGSITLPLHIERSKAGFAAQVFASRLSDVKKHLLLLENYYVLWGMGNSKARREAIRMTLGDSEWNREEVIDTPSLNVAPEASRPATTDAQGPHREAYAEQLTVNASVAEDTSTFLEEGSSTLIEGGAMPAVSSDHSAAPPPKAEAAIAPAGSVASPVLSAAMAALHATVGNAFQTEMSKIARIGDLAEFANQNWGEAQLVPSIESYDHPYSMSSMVVVLSDVELKSIYLFDNQFPENYYTESMLLELLDREEDELGAVRPKQKGAI
jgi:hypothetical protein